MGGGGVAGILKKNIKFMLELELLLSQWFVGPDSTPLASFK